MKEIITFKQGDDIPKYMVNYDKRSIDAVCKFGVDVEVLVTDEGYDVYPLEVLRDDEVLMIMENLIIEEGIINQKLKAHREPRWYIILDEDESDDELEECENNDGMTVKELIEILKQYDENMIVFRDYEGCYRDILEEEIIIEDGKLRLSIDW